MSQTTVLPNAKPIQTSDNTSASEIRRIYQLQQENRWNIRRTSASERIIKLKAIEKKIEERREDIHKALFNDFRKPAPEVDLTEIYPSMVELRHTIANLRQWMKPTPVETPLSMLGSDSEIRYEPKGVSLIISPWNYPFNLGIIPLVGAIAAGCTAILKPSEFTPHTSRLLKSLLGEIFNENEVAVVEGDHTVSQELLNLKFDHIYFTGSPAVGKIIMREASKFLTSVTLELGGKSPVIIDETANIAETANKVAWGKFLNCGQTCVAPDYILVHEKVKDQFLTLMKEHIQKFYGNASEDRKNSPDLARIINSRHHSRIAGLIQNAIELGANVEIGGNLDASQNYIEPTILTNVPRQAEIMEEEIFGPVLPVLTWSKKEEVYRTINSMEKPLALYIFTKSKQNREDFLTNTTAGGTCINDTVVHVSHPNLPFGGVNNSGIGNGHGLFSFKAFSHERAVLKQNVAKGAPQFLYPPYTDFTKKFIRFVMKYF